MSSAKFVLRLNYGVVFEPIAITDNSNGKNTNGNMHLKLNCQSWCVMYEGMCIIMTNTLLFSFAYKVCIEGL